MIKVEMVGIDTVVANVGKLDDASARRARNMALYTQAQRTLTKAIGYTPVETGALRASGIVSMVGDDIYISFGGPAAPYAIYVHEILTNSHPVGQAKFLERAVTEDGAAFIKAAQIP